MERNSFFKIIGITLTIIGIFFFVYGISILSENRYIDDICLWLAILSIFSGVIIWMMAKVNLLEKKKKEKRKRKRKKKNISFLTYIFLILY